MSIQYTKRQLKGSVEGAKDQVEEFKETYFGDKKWHEGLGGKAFYPLKKLGDVQDFTNQQVNLRNLLLIDPSVTDKIPGKWDDNILNYPYKDLRDHTAGGIGNVAGFLSGGNEQVNDAGELLGQVLLPDAVDFIGGVGYLDNLAKLPKALQKMSAKDASRIVEDVFSKPRFRSIAGNVKESVYENARKVKETVTRPISAVGDLFRGGMFREGGPGAGGPGKIKTGDGYINPLRQPEVPQVVRQALGHAGIRDDGTFHLATYLKNRKHLTSKERRALAGLFMTDPMKGFAGKTMDQALTSYTKTVKAEFMKVYTPEFLAKYDIDPSQVQLHHINALLSSLPLYDGVRYMSKEWMELTGTLLAKNVHSGHSLENLRFLVGRSKDFKTPHGITHKYLDEVVGPDGSKFFNELISHNGKSMTRLEYMKLSDANRIEVVNNWADIVTKGNSITDQAVGVFNAINADLLNLKAENIDEIMSSIGKLQANGLVKPELIDGRWQIGAKEMRELLFDIDFTENIGQHFLLADPQGLRALRIALQSDNPISAYRAVRETLPKQLSLFSDKKVKTLAKKTRRYKDKRWDIPDDVPPPRGEGEFPETGELDEYGRPL